MHSECSQLDGIVVSDTTSDAAVHVFISMSGYKHTAHNTQAYLRMQAREV